MMIETSPVGSQARDQVEDHRALLGAHRRQRLVEQDDVGVRVHRARDRDRLALAAGEARDGHVQPRMLMPISSSAVRVSRAHPRFARNGSGLVHLLAAQEHVLERPTAR